MIKKFFFIVLICFYVLPTVAQNSVNDYKYVVVPNQFEFSKEPNQYRLNELTKFLFKKNGFIAIMQDEALPTEAISNGCLVLKSDVLSSSSMFKTKLNVQLKNCRGEVVYTSEQGRSGAKKYVVAYNEALREAFNSISTLQYKYTPNEAITSLADNKSKKEKEKIEKLEAEIKQLKEKKAVPVKEVVLKEKEVKTVERVEGVSITETTKETKEDNILYAKGIDNGFQVFDSNSNKVMILYYTAAPTIYVVKGRDAIVFKKGDFYILSETTDKGMTAKGIKIEFEF